MSIDVRPMDTASPDELQRYLDITYAGTDPAYGRAEVPSVAELAEQMAKTRFVTYLRHVAVIDGEIVGIGTLGLPNAEYGDSAALGLTVHPDFQGQGVATALLERALLPALAASGRSLVFAEADIPGDRDIDDPDLPANRLARRLGLSRTDVSTSRVRTLPLPESLVAELEHEVAEKIGDYRIEIWRDGVPEHYRADYDVLLREALFSGANDVPAGHGESFLIASAIAPDGSLAGHSEVAIDPGEDTTQGTQVITLVMPEHRGHRLGLAMKLATHRLIGKEYPQLRALVTYNKQENEPILRINECLGYRIAGHSVAYEGSPDLGALLSPSA